MEEEKHEGVMSLPNQNYMAYMESLYTLRDSMRVTGFLDLLH